MIKRAENIYPETAQDGSKVGVVASYVHGKVGTDVTPAHIEVRPFAFLRIFYLLCASHDVLGSMYVGRNVCVVQLL